MRLPSRRTARNLSRGGWVAASLLALALAGVTAAVAAAAHSAGARKRPARPPIAIVKVRKTALGRVLVDARGRTLYLYTVDRRRRSACYGACASLWPPYLTRARPRAGAGVRRALLGTTRRRNGRLQVTYRGHPLYAFKLDAKAGETRGEGVKGVWYALSPRGTALKRAAGGAAASTTPATTTTTPATTTPTATGGSSGGAAWG